MTDNPVIVAGPVVILTGPDLEAAHTAILVAQRNLQRNRVPDNPAYRRLAAAMTRAMSACPRTDRPKPAGAQTQCRWITTVETAEKIGCTERHARRLAPQLNGDRSTGRWLIPEHAVMEHVGGQHK